MSILVFGKTGQVATELQRQSDVVALGRDSADLTDPNACAAAILQSNPSAVINAAAYTAVDKAEDEEAIATLINADAPAAMAKACATLNIPFVHISTDYVFDGSGEAAKTPFEATQPLGAYGRSKLAGEAAVAAAGGRYAILRTSWVFSAHGSNFVKTMLRLAETQETLTIVADQVGGPTPAADIAATCLTIADALQTGHGSKGVYHYAGVPDVSWADFAREIFAQTGRKVAVQDIPTSAYPTPAKRPLNSRLDCTELEKEFGIPRPDWRAGLSQVLTELGAASA